MFADTYHKWLQPPIILTEPQKKFLKNLCEGKLTDTPRCFGKTFVIKLYCECLDYYTDSIKWYEVKPDDYISLDEAVNGFPSGAKLLDVQYVVDAYKTSSEKAMREYNFDEEFIKEYL